MRVLALGYESHGYFAGTRPAAFPAPPNSFHLAAIADVVADAADDDEVCLAVYPQRLAEPTLQRMSTVRSALGTTRLTFYGSVLPPLAGSVIASLAGALAPHFPAPGHVIAALPLIERELVVVAWLRSVTGLVEPAPGLFHHVLSLWPATSFAVSLWPQPSVCRLTKKDHSVPLPPPRRPQCLAVSARPGGDRAWIDEVVAPALGSPPIREVPPTELGTEVVGHGWVGGGRRLPGGRRGPGEHHRPPPSRGALPLVRGARAAEKMSLLRSGDVRPRGGAEVNPRQRRGVLLLLLASLGAVAVFVAVQNYVAGVNAKIGPLVSVLRLLQDAEPYEPLEGSDVEVAEIPAAWAPEGAPSDPAEVDGLVSPTRLPAGTYLQDGMLVPPPALDGKERAVTTLVDAEMGATLPIQPGNLVDIVASFDRTENSGPHARVVIPCARVLSVGLPETRAVEEEGGGFDEESVVPMTFALERDLVDDFTFAKSFARVVKLALSSPGDECAPSRVAAGS